MAMTPQFGVAKRDGRPQRHIKHIEFRNTLGVPVVYNTNVGLLMGGQGWWKSFTSDVPLEVMPGTWTIYLEHEAGAELHKRVIIPYHLKTPR